VPDATAVVAIGGHALDAAASNLDAALDCVAELVRDGRRVVVTHGNGPQVGVGDGPLALLVARTQGELGWRIQRGLAGRIDSEVAALLCQVEVEPAEGAPLKPIGPVMRAAARGRVVVEDPGRGLRHAVPSPRPRRVIEQRCISQLLEAGVVVVAGGGGGIPVRRIEGGGLEGVEAVVDKDWTSGLIAEAVEAELMLNLTSVDRVRLEFASPRERPITRMTVEEAKLWLAEGQFPPGSMGPKIESSVRFLERGGRRVLITTPELGLAALGGRGVGTEVTRR
jgi:carbamate kinase